MAVERKRRRGTEEKKRKRENERKREKKRKRCSRFSPCMCARMLMLDVSYTDPDINFTDECEHH